MKNSLKKKRVNKCYISTFSIAVKLLLSEILENVETVYLLINERYIRQHVTFISSNFPIQVIYIVRANDISVLYITDSDYVERINSTVAISQEKQIKIKTVIIY